MWHPCVVTVVCHQPLAWLQCCCSGCIAVEEDFGIGLDRNDEASFLIGVAYAFYQNVFFAQVIGGDNLIGANVLVAGSYVFGAENPTETIADLKNTIG